MTKKRAYGFNVAVKNLEEAVEKFRTLLEVEPRMLESKDFAFPGLRGACFDLNGFMVNLITSVEKNTAVANFLEKKGEGFFLFSLRTDDIVGEVDRLKNHDMTFIPQEIVNHPDWGKVIFIHPKCLNGIQLELIQPNHD